MGVAARIGSDVALIGDEPFAARCRMSPEAFTRRRKMPADTLTKTVIARKGRTLKMEVREFSRELGMYGGISAPGYLKAREKLNPEALLYLAQHHASNVYADGDCDDYKGMLLVAVDGSTANLPTTAETVARYGDASGHGKGQAMLGMSAAFDVINRQLLSLTIDRGSFDERAQVPVHLEAIPEIVGNRPFALVMDRGCPSFALMAGLHDAGVPYVMRAQSNFMNAEFRDAAAADGDSWEEAEFTYARLAAVRRLNESSYEKLKGRGPLPVRCVLVDIGGDAPEKIVTNIGPDVLSAAELKEVYHLRWGAETCFQMLKDRLRLENLTGTKPALIEQDVYAAAYLLNVAFDMANEADAEARAATPEGRCKHEMTVNRSLAVGILKDELIRMVLADEAEREEMMSAIVAELGRNLVPVRRERTYPRDGAKKKRANRYSNAHKRVF